MTAKADILIHLVRKVQKKYNSEAFRQLYDLLSPQIYAICLRYMKNEDDAKDALQESFVLIYERINDFKEKGSFEGWGKRIAVHQCIYKLKKKKINITLEESHIEFEEQKDFDEQKRKYQIKNKLKEALNKLPDGFRTIINLNIIEGYSHVEIAQMLNISEGTSRSQLNRAKVALKKRMLDNK